MQCWFSPDMFYICRPTSSSTTPWTRKERTEDGKTVLKQGGTDGKLEMREVRREIVSRTSDTKHTYKYGLMMTMWC